MKKADRVRLTTPHGFTADPYGVKVRFVTGREWPHVAEGLNIPARSRGSMGMVIESRHADGTPTIFIYVSDEAFKAGEAIDTLAHEAMHAVQRIADLTSWEITHHTTEPAAYLLERIMHEGRIAFDINDAKRTPRWSRRRKK